ncbi:murein transglycosylase A [Maricaulis sp. CAU 1757]
MALVACQDRSVIDPEPEPEPEPLETPAPPSALDFAPTSFDALTGWSRADLAPALAAFRRSCERLSDRDADTPLNPRAPWSGTIAEWQTSCTAALSSPPAEARAVFEAHFSPVIALSVVPETGERRDSGLLTGYYEPYVEVRRQREGEFTQPLRYRPDDLVTVDLGLFDPELAGHRIVGEVRDGRLVHYKTRDEIETADAGEIFAWGRPIDVFFLQIQGSGRLVYPDGSQERAAFAAHNGQPYRSIGRELIERGELAAHAASKGGIEAWLVENGPEATAELFAVNPRYVFFARETLDDPQLGPRGSSGVALTPMASIAVDPAHHAHALPVWLVADLPDAPAWRGLVIAQDAGGAITGPLRGDFFWGWGEDAERRAGTTRADARWTLLLPHTVVARLFAEPVAADSDL